MAEMKEETRKERDRVIELEERLAEKEKGAKREKAREQGAPRIEIRLAGQVNVGVQAAAAAMNA